MSLLTLFNQVNGPTLTGVQGTGGVGTLTPPVAVTAFTSACFSTTTPDSVNLNLFGANFLVVAVGWSSASSAYTPPLVVCNGEVMTLVTSAKEWDTASGAVAIYTLPIFNAANTSVPITLTQTSFIGNVQIAAYAYKNSTQSLGVIVTDEYGTNSSGVNTGTTAINGISVASAFTFAGFTFFGGTPTSITFPSGWTAGNQATGTNEGVYCAYTNQTGNYSVTVTPSPNSFFNMLCMGWEVPAGQPPSTGSGVNLVAYTAVTFGSVTAAAPGNTTFDPTTAANLLVATVGWASSSTLTAAQATATFAGSTMTLQSAPQIIDSTNNGEVAVWTLPLSSATSGTFTFNCSPNFAGLTSVVLAAYSNASGTLGITVIDEYGSNGSEVPSGTTAISNVTYGSCFGYVAMGFFGNAPTYLDCSTGWNPISNASATNQSVYAFNYRYQNQHNFSITLQNPTVNFNTINVGYEVLSSGGFVTGVASTGAAGTITADPSANPLGATGTGQVGGFVSQTSVTPLGVNGTGQIGAVQAARRIYLTTAGAGTWTVPFDWSNTNTIEVIAGGGGGAAGNSVGPGGGAYSLVSNITTLTPLQVVNTNVGAGGTSGHPGTDGGDTWLGGTSLATSLVGAQGGKAAPATGSTGGLGGDAANGVGTTKYSGGNGGGFNGTGVGAGGGAGGPYGPGGNGGNGAGSGGWASGAGGGGGGGGTAGGDSNGLTSGGNGGNNYLGTGGGAGTALGDASPGTNGGGGGGAGVQGSGFYLGGAGGAGTEWDSTHGSGGGGGSSAYGDVPGAGGLYGGGAGSTATGSTGADGAQGIIVITYVSSSLPPGSIFGAASAGAAGTVGDSVSSTMAGVAGTGAAGTVTGNAVVPSTVVFLTTTGAGTWTVPSDWSNTNTIEVIAGGGGGNSGSGGFGTIGAGGGAYSLISNTTALTPAQVVNINVGAGGTTGAPGANGGDTWLGGTSLATSLVGAQGGQGAPASGSTGGLGGDAANGIGTTKYSGGNGGGNNGTGVGAGGGAGGPHGPGGNGGNGGGSGGWDAGAGGGGGGGGTAGGDSQSLAPGGDGGNNYLGSGGGAGTNLGDASPGTNGGGGGGAGAQGSSVYNGGAGGAGTEWDSTHGSGGGGGSAAYSGVPGAGGLYGGGAGSTATGTTGADGAQGIIVITYSPAAPGTSISITGVAGTGQAGSVTTTVDDTGSLTGVAGTGQAGSVTTTVDDTGSLTGIAGTGQAGSVTTTVDDTISIVGVEASGQAARLSFAEIVGAFCAGEVNNISSSSAIGEGGVPVFDNIDNPDTYATVPLSNSTIAASFSTGDTGGNLTRVRILLHA